MHFSENIMSILSYTLLTANVEIPELSFSQKTFEKLGDVAFELVKTVIIVLLVWFIGSKVIKFVIKLVKNALARTNMDAGAAGFLTTFINVALKLVLAFMILGYIGVDTSSIIAIVGSAGLTAGLALQGALSNFAGGVLLLIQKPFVVGDFITACGHSGTVKKIDLFYTRMLTYDNNLVVIPNGTLMNTEITNTTYAAFKMIVYKVGVDYSSDVEKVKKALMDSAECDSRAVIDDEHPVNIFISSFDASAITMELRFFVKTDDYWPAKFAISEEVKKRFDKEGIQIPFDQIDVHMKN